MSFTGTKRLIIVLLCSGAAWGQGTPSKDALSSATLTFEKTTSLQPRKEIEQTLRTIGAIKELTEAAGGGSFTVQGTASQLDLVGWLFQQLDGAAESRKAATTVAERVVEGASNDVARVYFLARPTDIQDFQEACQAIRTVTGLRAAFTYNAAMALIVRGTPDQQTMAGWLVQELERKPPVTPPSKTVTDVFSGSTARDSVRVAFLANIAGVQEFQEIAQATRTTANIAQVFTHNPLRAIAFRGPSADLDLAQWILEELDHPAVPVASLIVHEQRVDPSKDDFVRVFYLAGTPKPAELASLANSLREVKLTRVFMIAARDAIVVRDTAFNLNAAESKVRGQ